MQLYIMAKDVGSLCGQSLPEVKDFKGYVNSILVMIPVLEGKILLLEVISLTTDDKDDIHDCLNTDA